MEAELRSLYSQNATPPIIKMIKSMIMAFFMNMNSKVQFLRKKAQA